MKTGTPAKINGEWGGVRMNEQASPGEIVTVQTKTGKSFQRKLLAVANQYPDATIWSSEGVDQNGAGNGGGYQVPQSSGPAQNRVPAPAAGSGAKASASELMQVAFEAYESAINSSWPAESAARLAVSISIAVQRGAENDLDPFSE